MRQIIYRSQKQYLFSLISTLLAKNNNNMFVIRLLKEKKDVSTKVDVIYDEMVLASRKFFFASSFIYLYFHNWYKNISEVPKLLFFVHSSSTQLCLTTSSFISLLVRLISSNFSNTVTRSFSLHRECKSATYV